MHSGIVELSEGTGQLKTGVLELHDGTDTLYSSTNNLPAQMQEEIDKLISEFDKSEFKPVSFVSPKNNEVINSVQFVMKTAEITLKEKGETETKVEEKEKGFWDRLMDLFS
ncbi:hypothetical protein [Niallia sp. Krafla_26]|uniref:hypothetical protein n=1 Tax=Niallia sp. Krafla_26 TaxID=3064703 RepID=UPI003D183B27